MPDKAALILTAKYLGVAPWDLEEREADWMDWGAALQRAESDAHADIMRRVNQG